MLEYALVVLWCSPQWTGLSECWSNLINIDKIIYLFYLFIRINHLLQNYDKALEALKEAIKCLAKSSDTDTGVKMYLFITVTYFQFLT